MEIDVEQAYNIGKVNFANMDITTVQKGVVCHGVNCQGKMKSGVAKFIRAKWPSVYKTYLNFINENEGIGGHLLGKVDMSPIKEGELYVANCFSQEYYGYDGKVYADAGAIILALSVAFHFAHDKNLTVYVPHIGGKRGGLNFYQDILPSIYYMAEDYGVHVVVCEWNE